jgi:peroxiredoxin
MLMPRQKTPGLTVQTLSHGEFDLAADGAEQFTMLVFYRGLHCPVCAKYLKDLARLLPKFSERGVRVLAVSADGRERAQQMADNVASPDLRFGYDLQLEVARDWGLYISTSRGVTSIGIEEPALFSEPGVFLMKPDQSLYYGSVQTMPFVRPVFAELVGALDFAIANDYPARGEYIGAV